MIVHFHFRTNGTPCMTRLHLRYVHAFRDRHGRLRHYFRRKGTRKIPLPGLSGSEEFMQAYQEAVKVQCTGLLDIGSSKTQPGTINALVVSYYRSTEWTAL